MVSRRGTSKKTTRIGGRLENDVEKTGVFENTTVQSSRVILGDGTRRDKSKGSICQFRKFKILIEATGDRQQYLI